MTPEQIKDFIEQMRIDLGFRSDAQLARYLGVEPITVYRWKQGELDTTKQRLIAYLLQRNGVLAQSPA